MIAALKPHPAMKDSGLEWLGGIPDHWYVERAKWLFRDVARPVREGDEVVTCFRDGTVTLRRNRRLTGFTEALKEIGYQGVRRGDLVIHVMDAFAGAIGVSDSDGKCTPVYAICEAEPLADPHYYARLVREMARRRWLLALAKGVRERSTDFRFAAFAVQRLPVPPLPEQAAIVRYLDHADRRISRYIRAKQSLIALLEEEKQAIIHRAVTRGLDLDVRLKPSGVEWLGDMPQDWNLTKFKFLVNIASGQVDPRNEEHRGKVLVAPNHIHSGTGQIFLEETAERQGAISGKYEVRRGQVIYSKIRPNLRKAALAREDCLCSADMYPLAIREDEMRAEFLLLILLSVPFTRFAVDCSLRAAMPKINREALGEGWLWYPDLSTQDAILRQTEELVEPVDRAINRARQEIELLGEYRTRLIADLVTGKLDVRGAAASLAEVDPADLQDTIEIDGVVAAELNAELEEVAT